MATYTVQEVVESGLTPTYGAVASADKFANPDGRTFLHVKNGGGGSINVTITSQARASAGLAQANRVVAVPASGERVIGPFNPGAWNDVDGYVNVAFSGTTSVTAAAVHVPAV